MIGKGARTVAGSVGFSNGLAIFVGAAPAMGGRIGQERIVHPRDRAGKFAGGVIAQLVFR